MRCMREEDGLWRRIKEREDGGEETHILLLGVVAEGYKDHTSRLALIRRA